MLRLKRVECVRDIFSAGSVWLGASRAAVSIGAGDWQNRRVGLVSAVILASRVWESREDQWLVYKCARPRVWSGAASEWMNDITDATRSFLLKCEEVSRLGGVLPRCLSMLPVCDLVRMRSQHLPLVFFFVDMTHLEEGLEQTHNSEERIYLSAEIPRRPPRNSWRTLGRDTSVWTLLPPDGKWCFIYFVHWETLLEAQLETFLVVNAFSNFFVPRSIQLLFLQFFFLLLPLSRRHEHTEPLAISSTGFCASLWRRRCECSLFIQHCSWNRPKNFRESNWGQASPKNNLCIVYKSGMAVTCQKTFMLSAKPTESHLVWGGGCIGFPVYSGLRWWELCGFVNTASIRFEEWPVTTKTILKALKFGPGLFKTSEIIHNPLNGHTGSINPHSKSDFSSFCFVKRCLHKT